MTSKHTKRVLAVLVGLLVLFAAPLPRQFLHRKSDPDTTVREAPGRHRTPAQSRRRAVDRAGPRGGLDAERKQGHYIKIVMTCCSTRRSSLSNLGSLN